MKLALLQMEVLEKNKAGNVEKACNLLKQAAPQADIAVLPEIWTTGYSLGHLSKEAEYLNGPVIEEIRSIAAANSCAVVAGSIPLRKGKILPLAPDFAKLYPPALFEIIAPYSGEPR